MRPRSSVLHPGPSARGDRPRRDRPQPGGRARPSRHLDSTRRPPADFRNAPGVLLEPPLGSRRSGLARRERVRTPSAIRRAAHIFRIEGDHDPCFHDSCSQAPNCRPEVRHASPPARPRAPRGRAPSFVPRDVSTHLEANRACSPSAPARSMHLRHSMGDQSVARSPSSRPIQDPGAAGRCRPRSRRSFGLTPITPTTTLDSTFGHRRSRESSEPSARLNPRRAPGHSDQPPSCPAEQRARVVSQETYILVQQADPRSIRENSPSSTMISDGSLDTHFGTGGTVDHVRSSGRFVPSGDQHGCSCVQRRDPSQSAPCPPARPSRLQPPWPWPSTVERVPLDKTFWQLRTKIDDSLRDLRPPRRTSAGDPPPCTNIFRPVVSALSIPTTASSSRAPT